MIQFIKNPKSNYNKAFETNQTLNIVLSNQQYVYFGIISSL